MRGISPGAAEFAEQGPLTRWNKRSSLRQCIEMCATPVAAAGRAGGTIACVRDAECAKRLGGPLTVRAEEPLLELPEDVAILYSWANLQGAKYRDFSASRREYRAEVRYRAAEDLRQAELAAMDQAEAAAMAADRGAEEAERAAQALGLAGEYAERAPLLAAADMARRRAAAERVEVTRRAAAAAAAEAVARREEREIAEAHASAERQAARWADAAGEGVAASDPRVAGDLYEEVDAPRQGDAGTGGDGAASEEPAGRSDSARGLVASAGEDPVGPRDEFGKRGRFEPEVEARRRPQGYRLEQDVAVPDVSLQTPEDAEAELRESPEAWDRPAAGADQRRGSATGLPFPGAPEDGAAVLRAWQDEEDSQDEQRSGPAWLYDQGSGTVAGAAIASEEVVGSDRLGWDALREVFGADDDDSPQIQRERERGAAPLAPVLVIFSLAGGVGKTSLTAALARALCSLGEKVLLAETTGDGLLPYYFGATEPVGGEMRTLRLPGDSTETPISLGSYPVRNRVGQERLSRDLQQAAGVVDRALLDSNASPDAIVRGLAGASLQVLVPMLPDMNAVLGLRALERCFAGVCDDGGHVLQPYYVLNQFDAELPLHVDVREVLRTKLGERLLPFAIRRSPEVSEALAEGMTVMDYAPGAEVASDYRRLAEWVCTHAGPAKRGFRDDVQEREG